MRTPSLACSSSLFICALLAAGCAGGPATGSASSAAVAAPIDVGGLKSLSTSVTCDIAVEGLSPDARSVRLWLPLPPSNAFQEIARLQVQPQGATVRRDAVYGNQLVYLEWQAPFSAPPSVTLSYDLLRREEVAHPEDTDAKLLARFLSPDRLGVIDQRIQDMAAKATAGRTGAVSKARGIYDQVLAHMQYDKETPGWGKGDTVRACDVGRGNCSDYHSLFISMARASKIPARFHYGYSVKPDGQLGAHCWAEFHDRERGWVPVDISEADKDPAKTDYFFGRLSENRVVYTTGRDLMLDPPQAGEPLNFLIDAYVEVDGKPHTKLKVAARHQARPATGASG